MTEDTRTRRENGDGTLYQRGKYWWIAYFGPDGKRAFESSKSTRKEDAAQLLRKRTGALAHNLPVVAKAEHLTFDAAAQAMIEDFQNSGKKSLARVQQAIDLHLKPYFGGRRVAGVTAADVRAYVTHRKSQTVKRGDGFKPVSHGTINRELQILKRIFNLAMKDGRLGARPYIPMLREAPPRSGFFEPEQFASVCKHLPEDLQPVVTFAYITGWRIKSEVLSLEWRQVDFDRGVVTLDEGATKNGEGRTFVMTKALRTLLEEQDKRRKATGRIVPSVFFRMVAKGRGGEKYPKPITSFTKAWRNACRLAGCPGRIPHDFRRTAVRNLDRAGVPRSVAMRMVGHKTEAIYRRYRIVDEQDLRDAAARLDAVAGTLAKEA